MRDVRETSRDGWNWRWLEDAAQDFRFAWRLLRRKPGMAAVATLTLCLGIGAATSVFSIVDSVLLRPLPYKDPERLVAIWGRSLHDKGLEKVFAPYDDYEEWSRKAGSFESIGVATWAFSPSRILTGRGPARQLLAIPVSASFFQMLGVSAAIGRTFTLDDEHHGCSVVLSHALWVTPLGGDRSIPGQSLTLDGRACTVLGVMPANFRFYPRQASLWVLLGPDFTPPREQVSVGIFARLKPGVTREQAQAEIAAMHRALHPSGFWSRIEPAVYDLHGEFTFLASRTLRSTLLVVFTAVLLVLLIACVNIANLLLARLAGRQRELSVRAALGSGRGRLARQVLTEGFLLSIFGTSAGILFTFAAVRYFRFASPIELSVGADVQLNLTVFLFSGGLALGTTLLFALLPAFRTAHIEMIDQLKTGGRGAAGGVLRQRSAALLIAGQMGLSFVLLIGAGLLLRSALRMGSEPLGFNPDRLFNTHTILPASRYGTSAKRLQFYDAWLERVNRLPGVAGAALTSGVPPQAYGGSSALEILGQPVPDNRRRLDVGQQVVGPNFFELLEVPLRRGRAFNANDRAETPPVAVINEALAREYFPTGDPLGKQVRIVQQDHAPMPWLTIVGVAGNLKHPELMNEMAWDETPEIYRPLAQDTRPGMALVVRARPSAPPLAHQIQEQLSALDPSVPVNAVEPVTADIATILAYPRFRAVVLSFFAVTALLLSAVGLHGVLSQLVARRTPEFGIRKAVGAQTGDLALLVMRQGGIPVVIGLGGGLAATLAFTRLLTSLLYGIRPADPAVLAAVSVVLVGVSAAALAVPAWRAGRVDPMAALREE